MPITELQRETRRKHIGSSDMAAVLGVSPWMSLYELWLEKTGRLEPDKTKKWQDEGTLFEPVILDWAETKIGRIMTTSLNPVRTEEIYKHSALECLHKGGILISHPDGLTYKDAIPVEAKTSNPRFKPAPGQIWGPEDSDDIPEDIIIQCHVHMMCLPLCPNICHVPAFIHGRGLQMFHVKYDSELATILEDKAGEFWHNHVEKDEPPGEPELSLAVAKRIRKSPKVIVQGWTFEDIEEFKQVDEELKALEKRQKKLKAAIIARLGDGEQVAVRDYGTVTYFTQHRKETTIPASDFRVLRIKKGADYES